MKTHALAIVIALVAARPAHAFDASGLEYERTIEGITGPGLYRADVDAELYRHSREEALGDLRIIDPDGKDVPWLMRRVPLQQEPKSWAGRIVDSSPQSDGSTQVVIDVGSGQRHTDVTLTVDNQNDWQRQARVEASDDNSHWTTIADGAWIFRYHAPHIVVGSTIHYATSSARWLRVTIVANGQPPMGVTAVSIGYVPPEAHQVMRLMPAQAPKPVAESGSATANAWTIDLGQPGVPLAEVALAVDDPSFARRAFIATATEPPNWMPLATTLLWRAAPNPGGVAQENVHFETGGTRVRYLRIDVVNGDQRPLSVREVSPAFVAEEIVFRTPAGGGPYTLYVGSDSIKPANYDPRAIYKGEQPKLTASFGTMTPNTGFANLSSAQKAKTPKQPKQGTHGFSAFVVIAIIIVIILAVVWFGGRRRRR